MSADKHKGLALRTAYLRLAASQGDAGFAVQIKWAYAVTSYVEDLLKLGHLRRTRQAAGGRKRVTCMVSRQAARNASTTPSPAVGSTSGRHRSSAQSTHERSARRNGASSQPRLPGTRTAASTPASAIWMLRWQPATSS
jgi:hypothetical protein